MTPGGMGERAMKAIVASPSGPVAGQLPTPVAGPDGCVVRIECALITAGDLAAARWSAPFAPGHSFVGIVDIVHGGAGEAAPATALVGRRVAVDPVIRCGRCDRCAGGLSAHCRDRRILGRAGVSGGFAERCAVPLANIVALPPELDAEQAAFAVPVAIALEATRHVRVEGRAYISILGDDASALVAAQVMGRLNAAVRLLSRHRTILAAADRLGIRHRRVDEIGRRGDQDVVVDTIGTAESLSFAAELVRSRGTVVLTGAADAAAVPADLSPIVAGELRIQGSFYGPLREALALLATRAVQTAPLIERRANLLEGPAACRAAGEPGRLGVILRP